MAAAKSASEAMRPGVLVAAHGAQQDGGDCMAEWRMWAGPPSG
jgi:hypothetical protein